jgi:hypothetical protein
MQNQPQFQENEKKKKEDLLEKKKKISILFFSSKGSTVPCREPSYAEASKKALQATTILFFFIGPK